jgi:hypothetical protein
MTTEGLSTLNLDGYVMAYRSGSLSGKSLAEMVETGTITKTERRKIVKRSSKPVKVELPLTERQILRLATKEKKATPKMSKVDRNTKFTTSLALEKDKERALEAANFTTCLGCRKRGHFLKDCPKVNKNPLDDNVVDMCFNCGIAGHALRHCSKPRNRDGSLPFATCFICNRKGHISRDCHENPNGLYPKGGCCHICLQKDHLVRDCPNRTEEDRLMHATKKTREAQELEDREQGPRIGFSIPASGGGDDMEESYFANTADEDDEDDKEVQKEKKSSKKSKKRA